MSLGLAKTNPRKPQATATNGDYKMAKAATTTLEFDAVELPKSRGGFGKSNPVRELIRQAIEQLPVDLSYHVPATEAVPEPHKFYAHQVVAANTEYVRKALAGEKGDIRHFSLKAVGAEDKKGPGARLFRVANLTKAEAERRAEASKAALATREANKAKKDREAEAAKEAPATE
jgi:hypothetical protein